MSPRAEEAMAQAMRGHGIEPPEQIVADGRLHRFSTSGRRGDDAGWYVLHGDGVPAGAFGDWRSGVAVTWCADLGRPLLPDERAAARQRIEQARRQAEEEREQRTRQAADLARALWRAAHPADANHPYLERKGVQPCQTLRELDVEEIASLVGYTPQSRGEPLQGRVLLAPVKIDGKVATLEMIDEHGRKSALAGGIKSAGIWATGTLPSKGRLVLAEGVATALSIAEALGETVAAALSVGNLRAAGQSLRNGNPGLELLIAADLGGDGKPHPQAEQSARELGVPFVAPPASLGRGADFNDLHQAQGLDAVRQIFAHVQGPSVRLSCAADIEPEPVSWLWPDWIARGKLHILAGKTGAGKTTLSLALAAIATTGGNWPDGSRCAAPGDVILWSGEDDPRDTLTPRLALAGADLKRVHIVDDVTEVNGKSRPFDPAYDVPLLARQLQHIRPALLILDPIVSAVAGDAHKSNDVRRALQPLVELAASLGCAVVGITHLSKGTQGRDPIERVTGSIGFSALARVVLLAMKHESPNPGEPTHLLVRSKSNIGAGGGGIGYDLEAAESWVRIRWAGAVEGSARALIGKAEAASEIESDSELEDAKAFLKSLLADGPVSSKQIKADGDEAGFSWRTMHRAADALGVEKRKNGFGKASWTWALPFLPSNSILANTQSLARMGDDGTNGTNGTNGTEGRLRESSAPQDAPPPTRCSHPEGERLKQDLSASSGEQDGEVIL